MLYCQESIGLTCDVCYELTKEVCDPINVNPGLMPGDAFYLQIIDKFIARYTQVVTINMDGSFDIDFTLLPSGFFNQFAGKFELYLSTTLEGTDYVDMTLNSEVYKCIILTIEKTNSNNCC